MKKLLITILLATVLSGCTGNQVAKNFGGTYKIELPANRKLVNVTWKESDLWILTRNKREGETVESYEFKEDSTLGLVEGTVILTEH